MRVLNRNTMTDVRHIVRHILKNGLIAEKKTEKKKAKKKILKSPKQKEISILN